MLQPESLMLPDYPNSRIALGSCVSESLSSQLHPIYILTESRQLLCVFISQDTTSMRLLLPVNLSSCPSIPRVLPLRTLPSIDMVQERIIPISPPNRTRSPLLSCLLSGTSSLNCIQFSSYCFWNVISLFVAFPALERLMWLVILKLSQDIVGLSNPGCTNG